ncbi:MAG: nucleoside monophosphate kinase [Candidatus Lokiarchaeota archaeon]|nr:nucleoside monophosphate kinase [Candidatus Lokiarchaeota archaeon]
MNIVLFGPPGAGKGTLAEIIKRYSKIVHISTGDLFRENVKSSTPIGKEAKKYMDEGKLVPDSVVIGMVKERLARDDVKKDGFMLDGFPRTLDQAKALDGVTRLDTVAVLDIDKKSLRERILGRYNCPKCNRIYNIFNDRLKPKMEGQCDECKVALTHRADDNEETFEKRWKAYEEQSTDALEYYEERAGLVKHVDSNKILALTEKDVKGMFGL